MNRIVEKLTSRKFLLTILGVVVSAFADELGLTPDQVTQIVGGIGAYVVGEGISDTARGRAS